MQKQRDHPKKHSMENIIMIILIISISITSFGLLGTLFKPSNNTEDDTSIKVDGSFNGSITVDHNTNKNPEKDNVTEGETDTEGNDENADTDTEPSQITLYLKPNSNWISDGARFAVYIWDDVTNPVWYDMIQSDEEDIYEVSISSDLVGKNIIFCRMSCDNASNSWMNKWNQTADLVIPSDGNTSFVVPAEDWDTSHSAWVSYTEAVETNNKVSDGDDELICVYLYDVTDTGFNRAYVFNDGIYTGWYTLEVYESPVLCVYLPAEVEGYNIIFCVTDEDCPNIDDVSIQSTVFVVENEKTYEIFL